MWTSASKQSIPVVPPFSPVLLAGLALSPVPPRVLQPVFDHLLATVQRQHPDILDRLGGKPSDLICVDPVDLPFCLLLTPDPAQPRLEVMRRDDAEHLRPTAAIRGPLAMLIALAEGKVDGDAAFFSRQLVIEGDTEIILALRNAMDGAAIDLMRDITAPLGVLAKPAGTALRLGVGLFDRISRDMAMVRESLVGSASRTVEAQGNRINELEHEIAKLRKLTRRGGA